MRSKLLIYYLCLVLTVFAFSACQSAETTTKTSTTASETTTRTETTTNTEATTSKTSKAEEKADNNYLESIDFSNLVDQGSQTMLSRALLEADIEQTNIDDVLKLVNNYNETVGDAGLVKENFMNSENFNPDYDIAKIDQNWATKNENFIGYNCRMTAFLLMHDLIEVAELNKDISPVLMMDNTAINDSKNTFFTPENTDKYNTFFAAIDTELVKDIDVHLEKIKAYWQKQGISFKPAKATLISIWFHDELDNVLFVGHTGVLVPLSDDSLLFFEKLTFSDPYQLIKFNNRIELNDYLMAKYDIAYDQPTAKPFIMENDQLLAEYRPNPNNKK